MQRHLLEQSQPQQQQVPASNRFERKSDTYHNLELDNDQAKIAELIENDPYIAAAMEDFAYTHGLLDNHRHRFIISSIQKHFNVIVVFFF